MAILIEAKHDNPIVNRAGPFPAQQQVFGLGSERAEEVGDVRMTPTDENHLPLLRCTKLSCQLTGVVVAKTGVDFQFSCVCKWLQC